ncbi:RNA-directed DNA polymerase, eukaryota, reverse transcriptase zinc-binding domain protein, partial [Tanacetum coccineum]
TLIGCQYEIVGKLLANRLSRVIGSCVNVEQSAFIKGRNILDVPLILNECMAWYRKRKRDFIVFKVDFERAYDYLRWDYLDVVMENLEFGNKWRTWISGCLKNSRASILVNGSHTAEFEMFKGLSVPDVDIADMAKVLGCGVSKLPMMYLATNAMDGLGIGSIYALNASLLFKWIWQFRCSPNDLWVKVIKEIHEIDGGIGRGRLVKSSQSPWNAIVRSVHHLQSKGIHLLSACYRSVGDGNNIIFWDETLCGDRPLKEWFHRVYALDGNK